MSLLKREDGNAMVFIALAISAFLLMGGFVLDSASLFMQKSNLQKVANAAVLSGAQELTTTQDRVTQVMDNILQKHNETTSFERSDIQLGNRVDIYLSKSVHLAFGSLLGRDHADVKVHAAAELAVMGKAIGAAPLGIDDSIPLEYNKQYKLKVDQTASEYGYFGILALGGNGAATYEDNLRHGYQDTLQIGEVLDTQTGNIAGKTRTVIAEKVNQCAYTPGEVPDRDCSRILLVPTYKPYNYHGGQLKHVQVTGFAYFVITDPMSRKDTSITGIFINRAGRGTYVESAADHGAYAIRLTR